MTKAELIATLEELGCPIIDGHININAALTGEHHIDLGDSYYAELESHPAAHDQDSWGIYKQNQFSADRIGYATIYHYPDTGASIADIKLSTGRLKK